MFKLKALGKYISERYYRRGVFQNTFILTLGALLCVASLFILLLYYTSVQAMEKNLQETNIHGLEQVVSLTDTIFSSLFRDIEQITTNPDVVSAIVVPGIGKESRNFNTISALRDFESASLYVTSIALLSNYEGLVYSPHEELVQLTQLESASLFFAEGSMIASHPDLRIFSDESNIYLRKEFIDGYQGYLGELLICLDKKMLMQSIWGQQQGFIVASPAGEVLLSSADESVPEHTSFSNLDGSRICESKNQNGIWLFTSSDAVGLQFYRYYEQPTFGLLVLSERSEVLWLVLLLILVLVLIAFFVTWSYYRPMQKLLRDITVSNNMPNQSRENEWELIGQAFGTMNDETAHYKNLTTTVAPEIERKLFIDLIEGKNIYEHDLRLTLSGMNSPISAEGFFVLFTVLNGTTMVIDDISLREYVGRLNHLKTREYFSTAFSYRASLVVLIQFVDQAYIAKASILDEIDRIFRMTLDSDKRLYIGHSEVFQGLYNLSTAYPVAYSRAMYPTLPAEGNRPILADEIQQTVHTLPDCAQENAELMISRLIQLIFHSQLDAQERSLSTRILVENLNQIAGIYHLDSKAWTEFSAKDGALEVEVSKYSNEILAGLKEIKEKRKNKYLVEARNYVEEHYADPDISLASTAESIGIHSSYLSKLFNAAYQKGFSQYVNEVRVENARLLLMKDELLVRDIGNEVGFLSTQNFIRVFKRQTGCTPREYRQAMQNTGKTE